MDSAKLAELARQKTDAAYRAAKRRRKGKSPRPKPVMDPDGWKVYDRLYPYYYNGFIWVMIVLTLGICCFVLRWSGVRSIWVLYAGYALTGAFLLRWAIHWIIKLIRFRQFKIWRTTLPFSFNGWDEIWTDPKFDKRQEWYREVTVTVVTEAGKNRLEKSVNDALIIFIAEANDCFYAQEETQSGYIGDIRKKWMLSSTTSAVGSGDGGVLGEVYILVNKYLRMLQQEMGGIISVTIASKGGIITVDPLRIRSE